VTAPGELCAGGVESPVVHLDGDLVGSFESAVADRAPLSGERIGAVDAVGGQRHQVAAASADHENHGHLVLHAVARLESAEVLRNAHAVDGSTEWTRDHVAPQVCLDSGDVDAS
jgi:hypothetical protein